MSITFQMMMSRGWQVLTHRLQPLRRYNHRLFGFVKHSAHIEELVRDAIEVFVIDGDARITQLLGIFLSFGAVVWRNIDVLD